MIVALARKLLIALWRLVTTGEIPEGVELRPAVFQPGPEALRHSRDLVASPPQSGSGAVWIDVARSLGYASGREASIWIEFAGVAREGDVAADSDRIAHRDIRQFMPCPTMKAVRLLLSPIFLRLQLREPRRECSYPSLR
jgi:hypothetical protein